MWSSQGPEPGKEIETKPFTPITPIPNSEPPKELTEEELRQANENMAKTWNTLKPFHVHPYIAKKQLADKLGSVAGQLRSGYSKTEKSTFLAHPIVDVETFKLKGFQKIFMHTKKIEFGSKAKGNATIIGNLTHYCYYAFICEGFADGVHLHHATRSESYHGRMEGIPTIVATSAINMPNVARRLRIYRQLHLIICADVDEAGILSAMKTFIAFSGCHFRENYRPPRAVVIFPPNGKDFCDSVVAGDFILPTIEDGMKSI